MDGAKPKGESDSETQEKFEKGEDGRSEEAVQELTRMELEESAPQTAVGERKGTESEVKAKTGRAKRKEKRLRHEPQSVTGKQPNITCVNYAHDFFS